MVDQEEIIARSSRHMPEEDFTFLVNLTLKHSWLEGLSEALAELWNLCENDSEYELVSNLIDQYKYLNEKGLTEASFDTAKQICETWQLDSENTLIVATSDKSEADGSQFFIQSIKNKFAEYGDWQENNFCSRVGDAYNRLEEKPNIVLVDDFIGTGNTMKRRVNAFKQQINKRNLNDFTTLYVISIAAMEFSKVTLDKLDINYYCPIWLKKGITESFSGEELEIFNQAMINLEAKLEKKYHGKDLPSFGYKKSESLFAIMSFNVPNNVFPIFWWPEKKNNKRRKTLFRRLI
ncbi:MAG: hypothetical protein OEY29_13720 [Gammaproteobacteria bacterium]|nr:hypothetical protein [Gammaproteobacteria bacterium]